MITMSHLENLKQLVVEACDPSSKDLYVISNNVFKIYPCSDSQMCKFWKCVLQIKRRFVIIATVPE